jgi:hypothetical protein
MRTPSISHKPHLINDVIKELRFDGQNVAIKRTTGSSSKTLCRHLDLPPFDEHFNYRRVVGQLNYLEKCSRLDISCAVHQAARFVSNPRIQHGEALKWLGRYLVGSRDKGMIYSPSNQSFDVLWMPHSQGIGIHRMQSGTLTQQGQGLVLSFSMHHVQSYGLQATN